MRQVKAVLIALFLSAPIALWAQSHQFPQCVQVSASTLGTTGGRICSGTGSPESSVTGWIGDVYLRRDGSAGTSVYVKESGSGTNTGWVALASASGGGGSLSNPVTAVQGGTGQSSYTTGDLLYASSSSVLSKLAGVATGNALISGGVGTAPSWGKVALTTHVSGVLPTANGGTGQNSTAVFPSSGTLTTDDGTSTFTNKTLDAEGTGNSVTIPVVEFIPAAYCQNVTASTVWNLPTSNAASAACHTGSNTQKGTLDFADGANLITAELSRMLPSDWVGAVDLTLNWHATATTGAVVWEVRVACVADGETGDPAWVLAGSVTDNAKGVASQYNTASITGLTTTGCAAGEMLYIRIGRDANDASDTMTATARLVGIELKLRRAL